MSTRFGLATPEEIRRLSGRAFLQAMIDGQLPRPPISEHNNFALVEVGDGTARFEGHTGPHLCNPAGVVHGGWAMLLLDSATGCAVHSLLAPGIAYTTIETKINFCRPILPDTGRVECEARVLARGRQILTAEAYVRDEAGKLLAHGTSTLMVVDRSPR